MSCDFGVAPAADVDTALDALERYRQMWAHPYSGAISPDVGEFVAEANGRSSADDLVVTIADSRGAVLRATGPGRNRHLHTVLELTKDRDLAVLDVQTGHLYDPRGHVDVLVTVGDGRTLPYLTAPLLEDLVVAGTDPDDPFLVVARDDDNYIGARRYEWVYELEHRAGSEAEHFRVYTTMHTVVRSVLWAWACGDPSWSIALPWRRVDPGSPGIEVASGAEILLDELSSMTTGLTVDRLALLDTFLSMRATRVPTLDPESHLPDDDAAQ
ncbi:hypothetical protein [Nocardia sp. NBC_01009]|uniref:hypothetical protein n=1 Tax=Nocardia sp. NBC_01009 TaxID=2975996 RepID=UPI00386FC8AB|nr:hypothetical protein OHA42_36070 [Nocardia sp. NBC_01009]